MLKLAICCLALVGCGLPEKDHCNAAADCLRDEACHEGVCQPASHDACGPTRAACAADAMCLDAPGPLTCRCNAGFVGDGVSCTDIDECAASASACAAHASCTNMPGSFACACDAGFTGDSTSYCVPATFTKIAPGVSASCGLAADGGMYCWGHNTLGELGDGTVIARARPTQVGTATDWIDIDAQFSTACGRRADHSMWCWGLGTSGQLGDGKTMTELSPTQVISDKPGVGWKTLAVGAGGTCGVHDDGSLACWGPDRVNQTNAGAPVAVDANTDWTAVAVGTVRCGIRDAGHLYCWGKSGTGQLGLGTITSQATPAQVGSDTWKQVQVGGSNTCGIRSDGALLCWGSRGSTKTALDYGNTPQQVGTATDWQAISLSYDGIIGVRAGGVAYAWGVNDTGQLAMPVAGEVVEPTPVSGSIAGWSEVKLGLHHGCGIASGQAYCWGKVDEGNLGDGTSTLLYTPTKIGSDRWTSVAGGPGTCGVLEDGALMCWGYPSDTGVGFGNTDPVWAPTRLGADTWSAVTGSSSDAVPSVCALRDGKPYCWGENGYGQLGLGAASLVQLSPAAVKVPETTRWTEIAVSDHTCAITSDAMLWCWGANELGQLGTGMTSNIPTAAPSAPLGASWLHVAVARSLAGGSVTCGIKTDHTLWCWGQDPVIAAAPQLVPTQIGSEASWDSLSLGSTYSAGSTVCAIKLDGTLWCWGARLGDGTMRTSATPVQVGTAHGWRSVKVGSEICAIQADRTLWCWGNLGMLGDGVPVTYEQLTQPVTTPTQIGGDTDWSTVMTGSNLVPKTCATKTDGSLWCWGYHAAPIPGFVTTPAPIR